MKNSNLWRSGLLLLVALFLNVNVRAAMSPGKLSGTVSADGKPLAGVLVTDGLQFVKTDSKGKYSMQSLKGQGFVYIVTPNNYIAKSQDGLTPQFWQALDSTKKDERHDFELKYENQASSSVILMSDLHMTNSTKKHDVKHFRKLAMPAINKAYAENIKKGPVYCMQLGDFTHDVYWYDFNFNEQDGRDLLVKEKFPAQMYSVCGNHDNDGAVNGPNTNRRAEWLYRKVFGPTYYSVNIGGVHWLMLDDVIYENTARPGQKKFRGSGIVGNRNYRAGFTDDEMEWMKKDLEQLDPSTPLRVCMHIPPVSEITGNSRLPEDQMNFFYNALKKFENYQILNGHMHKMVCFQSKKFPGLSQYVLPALSGSMWERSDNYQTIGGDGCAAGFVVEHINNARMTPQFVSIEFPDKLMRAYDMNEVAAFYAKDPNTRKQMDQKLGYIDYAKGDYQNQIMINYWFYRPGDKIEAFENNKSLRVDSCYAEDPLWNMEQYADRAGRGADITYGAHAMFNNHIWMAHTCLANTPVKIRITDKSGKVVCEETVMRPKKFDKNAQ